MQTSHGYIFPVFPDYSPKLFLHPTIILEAQQSFNHKLSRTNNTMTNTKLQLAKLVSSDNIDMGRGGGYDTSGVVKVYGPAPPPKGGK